MANRNVDVSNKIVAANSGSTEFPNGDGEDNGQRTIVMLSRQNSLSAISPYSRVSTIHQQVDSQNLIPGPSIRRPMPQPSSIFSSLPPMSPSSASFQPAPVYDHDPSLLPVPNSGLPPVSPRPASFRSTPLSEYDPSMPPVQWSPNSSFPLVGPSSVSFGSSPLSDHEPSLLPVRRSSNFSLPPLDPSSVMFPSAPFFDNDPSLLPVQRSPNSGLPPVDPSEIAPSSSHLARSISVGSFDYWRRFTEAESNIIMGDKKLLSLVASSPKRVKSILANRASAARSVQKKAQYTTELTAKVETLTSENTTIRAMYNELREDHIAMETELRELKILHEGTEKHNQLLQNWNGQVNAQLSKVSAQLSEVTRELTQYRKEAGRANMQRQLVSPNMFQQLDINQFHQQKRNPDFDDQI